ncbi:hypothetical protein P2318_31200 [Myxococcaceae bacterium GXIMD 01537]
MSICPRRMARGGLCALGLLLCAHAAAADPVVSSEFSVGSLPSGMNPGVWKRPAVASNLRGEYLVVWLREFGVQAVRVDADGAVLGSGVFTLSTWSGYSHVEPGPSVAFDGSRYVVAWGTHSGIRVARIEQDGTVLDRSGRYVTRGPSTAPRIACHAGVCMLTWQAVFEQDPGDEHPRPTLYTTYVQRLRTEEFELEGSPFFLASDKRASVGAGPGGFLLLAPGMKPRLYPLEGPLSYREFLPITGTNARAIPIGERWLVVWGQGDIHGAVLDPALATSHKPFLIQGATGQHPNITYDGTQALVTWNEYPWGRARVARLNVQKNGKVLDPGGVLPLGDSYFEHRGGDVASGGPGHGFYTAYAADSKTGGGMIVLGQRLDADGRPRDGAPRVLSLGPSQGAPVAAHGPGEDLVVWSEARETLESYLYAVRVRPDGTPAGPEVRLPCAPGATAPAVAYDGKNYLVVWEQPGNGDTDIRGARIKGTGKLIDPGSLAISVAPGAQRRPAVAYAAKRLWVIWEDERNRAEGNGADIYGTRVRPAGLVMEPEGVRLSPLEGTQRAPTLTALDPNVLVLWEEPASLGGDTDIRGTRVKWNGTVLDPSSLNISTASGNQRAPKAASTGAQAYVVWEDEAGGTPRIMGTRVSETGLALEPGGVALAPGSPGAQRGPALTLEGDGWRAAWTASSTESTSIESVRVPREGTVEPGVLTLPANPEEPMDTPALSAGAEGATALFYLRHLTLADAPTPRLRYRLLYPPDSAPTP